MSLIRYKRMPSTHALDWSWFFQQVDLFAAAIDEPDETSIDSVERADFQTGTFLRASGAFKNTVSVKTDIALRFSRSKSHEPSPSHARFTAIEIECDKYTIANVSYRLRTHVGSIDKYMIYCAVAVGNRQLIELSSISTPTIDALLDFEDIKHSHDFFNSGTVELLEGTNKVYFIVYWIKDDLSAPYNGINETHQELTISEMR